MYQPVIIIGAPRSGTNMLRDMLAALPGVYTWPCDEINYIWRHGNVRFPSDEFTPDMATAEVANYIRREFDRFARVSKADVVVEKTCANSLRVGFIDKVIPDARYVFIVRDGLDAVGSALERWQANLDIPYILRKARYVPLTDLPYYATRYFLNHLYRLASKDKRLAFWGPTLNGMDEMLRKHSLTEVCALQWKRCVDNSERDLAAIPSDRVIRVTYEQFVQNPQVEFERIAKFVGKETTAAINAHLTASVRPGSVGKGRKALGNELIDHLLPLMADTLKRYGYE